MPAFVPAIAGGQSMSDIYIQKTSGHNERHVLDVDIWSSSREHLAATARVGERPVHASLIGTMLCAFVF